MNENYVQPPLPEGSEAGILRGMYLLREGSGNGGARVQLMGSGTILREAIGAADLLENDFGIDSDLWSVTSFGELRREGLEVERWNTLHPDAPARRSYVEQALAERAGPVIAATDYVRAMPTRSVPSSRDPTGSWAPTASAARIRERDCGTSSR